METQGKKPPSDQALDAELETVEVSPPNTRLEDARETENQTDLSWQAEDVGPEGDPNGAEATGRQPETHAPASDAEIEALTNRAKLAGNAVRHQVQEARAHSVLGRLWQIAALDSKPDINGQFHPARWKIGLWIGVPACLGFALVLATVLAPTATARQPCLPGELIAADGSSPCEPLASADKTNALATTGAASQTPQTPETAVVEAPALPKSAINGEPLPTPAPTLARAEPLRSQNDAVAPPAMTDAPNATPLETDPTMSSRGSSLERTYSAPSGNAPYLAPAQAIQAVSPSAQARNAAQPARAKTYVLANPRQPRAATVTFKPSPTAENPRSQVLASASEPPTAQSTPASSTAVSTDTPRTTQAQSAGRVEGSTSDQVQMQRTVSLGAPASSEPVASRTQAFAGDARASETQARDATVGGSSNPPTTPSRTVSLGSSNAPGPSAPGGDVAQAGLGQDTYPIGSQVPAKLRFGFLAVEGHDDVPVVAESADGSVWLGWASINKESRVEILFREVYIKGKAYLTGAQAYNLERLPGLNGTARYEAPNLVADLLQAAVGGISTYVSDLTQRGTTTTSGNTVTTSRSGGPTLGQTVLGRAANLFDIGKDTRALIRLVEVPADTAFLVIVLPKR